MSAMDGAEVHQLAERLVRNRTDTAACRHKHRRSSPVLLMRDTKRLFGEYVIDFIVWLIVGGVIGWLASMLMN